MRNRKIEYKKYNDAHKEERKKWRKNNKKHIKERNKKYYQTNKEKIMEVKKRWNKNNRKRLLFYHKIDKERHKNHHDARRIANRNIKIPIKQICQKCNKELAREKHHEDYNKPLKVKFLCRKCNNHWNETIGGKH